MATKPLVKDVGIKQENGLAPDPYYKFGAAFSEIIDDRSGRGNYTLAQFFDDYTEFMKTTTFVYSGANKPVNKHVGIWIDTSQSNQN